MPIRMIYRDPITGDESEGDVLPPGWLMIGTEPYSPAGFAVIIRRYLRDPYADRDLVLGVPYPDRTLDRPIRVVVTPLLGGVTSRERPLGVTPAPRAR